MNLFLRALLMTAAVASLPGLAGAKPWWMRGSASNEDDFLPPDVAFQVSSLTDGNTIRVRWVIADGYYLYRQRMDIKAESPDLEVSPPRFPPGTVKADPYLGTQEIFTQQVEATVPYTRHDGGAHPVQIKVTYQGCAEAGLCYPPISKVLFPGGNSSASVRAVPQAPPRWEGYAIGIGAAAFLLSGLLMRKGKRLATPP